MNGNFRLMMMVVLLTLRLPFPTERPKNNWIYSVVKMIISHWLWVIYHRLELQPTRRTTTNGTETHRDNCRSSDRRVQLDRKDFSMRIRHLGRKRAIYLLKWPTTTKKKIKHWKCRFSEGSIVCWLTHFSWYDVEMFSIVDEQWCRNDLWYPLPLKCEWRRLIIKNGRLNGWKVGILPKNVLSLAFRFDAFVFRCHDYWSIFIVQSKEGSGFLSSLVDAFQCSKRCWCSSIMYYLGGGGIRDRRCTQLHDSSSVAF